MTACGAPDGGAVNDVAPILDAVATGDVTQPEAEADIDTVATPVRFAVISDTHLAANRFAPANLRFRQVGERMAALVPPPEHVFATGDDVEDLMCSPEMLQANGGSLVLDVYRAAVDEAFGARGLPFHLALGNHDVRFFDTFHPEVDTLTPWLTVMEGTGALPAPWYAFDERGVAFVVLDSRGGATSYAENDAGTLGATQLAWLDAQLARGLPSVLFWHHDTFAPLDAGEGLEPAWAVIEAHPGVAKALFVGHGHRYRKDTRSGVLLFETADLKSWLEPGYLLVEIDPATGSVTVLNDADVPWGEIGTP